MFLGKLFPFQQKHEENLLKKCISNDEMILSAPTGSGKTVIASKFIDDYLDENPSTVFLWLCPGAGGLQEQSKDSFNALISGIESGDVYAFINEPEPSGKVYFINWDKINKSSNTVLRIGEFQNLMDRVNECHRKQIDIFMIIDEEHKYQETANFFISAMSPKHALKISATPTSQNSYTEVIDDEEVIAAGLITSSISINEGLSDAIEKNNNLDDDLLLIRLADEKRKQIKAKYDSLKIDINPLLLIQFPNASDEWIERVKATISDMGYTEENGLVTSWFSGDHPDDPESIKNLNGKYDFLLFKQAIATGWDCPRAKILVKLREGGTEVFNIQTIGRIRRMPEKKHYFDDLLDKCYVYTLDNKFKEGLTNSLSNSFYSVCYKKRQDINNIKLISESLDGTDKIVINPQLVVTEIRKKILEQFNVAPNECLSKEKMTAVKGFVFGTKLITSSFEGVARTTDDIKKLNPIFAGEHEIDNHADGFVIRDAKRKIAASLGIDENISNNALKILFGPQDPQMSLLSIEEFEFESKNKILKGMKLKEFNAFLINNKKQLIEMFNDISVNQIADIEETKIIKKEWSIPNEQYYKHHKKFESTAFMRKNVFQKYGNNILLEPNRSSGEILFEKWCENNPSIKYVYKNGDKGDEFFHIVYKTAFHRAHFYPDYIVQTTDNKIWIIEVKGGMSPEGESWNRDAYAKNKFLALKKYSIKNNINFGFVRSVGSQIYFSNTSWAEDLMDSTVWKPIELIIS